MSCLWQVVLNWIMFFFGNRGMWFGMSLIFQKMKVVRHENQIQKEIFRLRCSGYLIHTFLNRKYTKYPMKSI